MNNTYTYEIINLITEDSNSERPKNVFRVLTTVTATDTAGREKQLNCMFNLSPSDSFTPFDQLTEPQLREWVDSSLQWEYFHSELDKMLEEPVNPLIFEVLPPPWKPAVVVDESLIDMAVVGTTGTSISNLLGATPPPTTTLTQETVRALIYEVLAEINSGTV